MLELKDICVSFGTHKVLNSINIRVSKAELIAIIGHNGAGKSTLFDVISGRLKPSSGSVVFDGVDVTHLTEAKRAKWIGRLQQRVGQGSVANMTVRENFCLAALKGKRASLSTGAELFSDMPDVEHLLDLKMGSLSGGQQQLIAFHMAMVTKPKLLLLDEPTAALDPEAACNLNETIRSIAKEHQIPTLLITHDLDAARKLGAEVLELSAGSFRRGPCN